MPRAGLAPAATGGGVDAAMAQVLRVLRLMRLVKLVKIVSSGIYSDKMEEWVGLQGKSKLRCVARHVAAQRDVRNVG